MRGHRQSILGAGVTRSSPVRPVRHAKVGEPMWVQLVGRAQRPAPYQPPPEWRAGPGDPHIKRKWLMHIEDERSGEWKL